MTGKVKDFITKWLGSVVAGIMVAGFAFYLGSKAEDRAELDKKIESKADKIVMEKLLEKKADKDEFDLYKESQYKQDELILQMLTNIRTSQTEMQRQINDMYRLKFEVK